MRPYQPVARFFTLRELRTMLLLPFAYSWDGVIRVTKKTSPITGDDRRIVEAELRWIQNTSIIADYKQYWELMK